MSGDFAFVDELVPGLRWDAKYAYEWWHYMLRDEPYPDTYVDFPITRWLGDRTA